MIETKKRGGLVLAADLHCHTRLSDGSITVDELILAAKHRGVQTLAVTDHDTVSGISRAVLFGKENGVEVIPGIELSCFDQTRGKKVHVLGYCMNNLEKLETLCKAAWVSQHDWAESVIEKVIAHYPITREMVLRRAQGSTNIFRQHVMHALLDAGCADGFFGKTYQELFRKKTGLAWTHKDYPEVYSVIDRIHDAGGIAVVAHPGEYGNFTLIEELARKGLLDGIECWHPQHNSSDTARGIALAEQYGLLMTGGTDFHGMYTDVPRPVGSFLTPDSQLERLRTWRSR